MHIGLSIIPVHQLFAYSQSQLQNLIVLLSQHIGQLLILVLIQHYSLSQHIHLLELNVDIHNSCLVIKLHCLQLLPVVLLLQ